MILKPLTEFVGVRRSRLGGFPVRLKCSVLSDADAGRLTAVQPGEELVIEVVRSAGGLCPMNLLSFERVGKQLRL